MKKVNDEVMAVAARSGCAILNTSRIEVPVSEHTRFYSGVTVETVYYDGGRYGVGLEGSLRFRSPAEAEAFHDELTAFVLRFSGGSVEELID